MWERDFAIAHAMSIVRCSPAISTRAFAKHMAHINSPFARLPSLCSNEGALRAGIKSACAHGHMSLAVWYYLRALAITFPRPYLIGYALNGAYFAGNRAIIDYFLPLADKNDRAYLSAFCGAVKGNHMELLTWLDSFEYESHDEKQRWWCCGAVAAIKGGHMELYENFKARICHNANAIYWFNDLIWSHMLKRDNRAGIKQCITVLGARSVRGIPQLPVWRYASRDVMRDIVRLECNNNCDVMEISDFRQICSDGILTRVKLLFEVMRECHCIVDPRNLTACIAQENHNLAITEYLINQLARLAPLSRYQWLKFLMRATRNTSVAEMQYIVDHAQSLGHVITARRWRRLANYAMDSEMHRFLESRCCHPRA